MEHTNTKITRKEIIQIIFTILLAVAIAVLLFTIITLVKKSEEIKTDPIEYAIKNSNIESCICFNSEGQSHAYGKDSELENGLLWNIGDQELDKEK